MPNRWLKADILSSDRFNQTSLTGQAVYVRLLVVVDDHGRFDGRVPVILSACDPLQTFARICTQTSATDVLEWFRGVLAELEMQDLARFWLADTRPYLLIPRFYERPRSKSRYPEPPELLLTEQGCTHLHADARRCHLSTYTSTTTTTATSTLGNPPAGDSLSGDAPDTRVAAVTRDIAGPKFGGPPPTRKTLLNAQAVEAIAFLNKVSGSKFQTVEANVRPARARIQEFGLARVKAVIAAKAEEWRGNERMEPYLRPATLFDAEHFADYEGQTARPEPEAANA